MKQCTSLKSIKDIITESIFNFTPPNDPLNEPSIQN